MLMELSRKANEDSLHQLREEMQKVSNQINNYKLLHNIHCYERTTISYVAVHSVHTNLFLSGVFQATKSIASLRENLLQRDEKISSLHTHVRDMESYIARMDDKLTSHTQHIQQFVEQQTKHLRYAYLIYIHTHIYKQLGSQVSSILSLILY